MNSYYTSEKNVQMLIYLMKKHGIKKVIASPGTTNITFVASVQQDPYFEMYSAADERSAAYMACGLTAESGEPVALSCTGATASRNYVSGLTEAFYRKLPVLAITSTQHFGKVGQLEAQVIDRSVIQKDIAVANVQIPMIHSDDDEWDCNLKLNYALLALFENGGGPVHVNLATAYSRDFSVKELPEYRVIKRISYEDKFPVIDCKRVAIFVGAHTKWTEKLTAVVDKFCEKYNGVVFCDQTSNYYGKYRIQFNILTDQNAIFHPLKRVKLLIDMGEVSGAYMGLMPEEVWRVNLDGKIKDTWHKISKIFSMNEEYFFRYYTENEAETVNLQYYLECKEVCDNIRRLIPKLPFSNIWVAQQMSFKLPDNSVLHLGILNSLRSWNFFEIPNNVVRYCNTGGFGIDGILSAAIGSSLNDKTKLHFCVLGDLAFFYDMNSIANHCVQSNLRILLINNGCGVEFKNYSHFAAQFGTDADVYIAARGHYGNKSLKLVKHYAEDLGFEYLCASSKDEFLENMSHYLNPEPQNKPMVFEVFTDPEKESEALYTINHLLKKEPTFTNRAKQMAKGLLGESGVRTIKRFVKG